MIIGTPEGDALKIRNRLYIDGIAVAFDVVYMEESAIKRGQ